MMYYILIVKVMRRFLELHIKLLPGSVAHWLCPPVQSVTFK